MFLKCIVKVGKDYTVVGTGALVIKKVPKDLESLTAADSFLMSD